MMPPIQIVLFLAICALGGNIAAALQKFKPPITYYLLLAVGCFVVAGLYGFMLYDPGITMDQRILIARWGYIILFIPMTYPAVFYAARGTIWKS